MDVTCTDIILDAVNNRPAQPLPGPGAAMQTQFIEPARCRRDRRLQGHRPSQWQLAQRTVDLKAWRGVAGILGVNVNVVPVGQHSDTLVVDHHASRERNLPRKVTSVPVHNRMGVPRAPQVGGGVGQHVEPNCACWRRRTE
eukprot:1338039-Rhodomonas_salina.2